ncbi:conserved repeat domain-containing protein [Parafrankia irregularis]|uniref:Conserved repeat domain-containing protein n=1 Tax=Parafrankia irregularis TaxID=795642 RepID=A0A0S4QYZ6_9ACTN|nr:MULTISPECIES: putative Ig domain-containing protein [Parafrankia]MBE3205800.1 DUF11 domain-containing protein [Parafrankia sp. CH37]CUU59674.1 conserved repeat domain-containing protein [Parafrankia irregularis]
MGRGPERVLVLLVITTLLTGSISMFTSPPALAAGTVVFDQPFHNNTPNGTGAVVLPGLAPGQSGGNAACLTASGNSTIGVLRSCQTEKDTQGSGKLRLTTHSANLVGGVFGATSVPTSRGLVVSFNTYQYGGSSGGDGIGFVLAATDPARPAAPSNLGQSAGALGYSPSRPSAVGLSNAYLGVGVDLYGDFSNNQYEGTNCVDPPYIASGARVPAQVVVRGPGNGTTGYCAVNSTASTTSAAPLNLRTSNRASARVPVKVIINPTGSTIVDDTGTSVGPERYRVEVTPIGGSAVVLTGTLPAAPAGLYPSSSWTDADGVPRQLTFGWVGATGGENDNHEIDEVKVATIDAVPTLTVATTSYNGSSPQPGDPVTYTVTAAVAAGAAVTQPVTVTQTVPVNVVPVGAFGSGWVCEAPSGRNISCTNSNAPFAAGTSLPPITVVAIVTGSGVTPSLIQTTSVSTVGAGDVAPGYTSSTTAGTVPSAPTGLAITPTSGSVSGGGSATVTGTNIAGATAIEIGTTAEQRAGTPVVLLPCQSGPAAGCFTVNPNGSLSISSMPARSTVEAVGVTVVTSGIAGLVPYTYTSVPGTPAAPTATAGVASATVSWVAPSANGSTISSYVVTPSLNGVAQTPVTFDASTTTRTLTGLTVGGSYTFTVRAVNALGNGAASQPSAAVVPYNVPAAPSITAVSAGSQSATLTWSTPANNSSPITGYVVTPFINGVAQAPQTFTGTATTRTVTGLTGGTTYTFTVAAVNAAGTGPASAISSPVTANVSPGLTNPAPPAGEVGAAYTVQFTTTGGTSPFTWSLSSGSLPPGLILNAATGLVTGTPTTPGDYPFTLRVVDASGQSATQNLTIAIASAPTLPFPAPPAGEVGVAYSQQLTVSGGTSPFVWSVSAGALPAGLTLNPSTGLLSGTPTTAGTASFAVRVTDAFNQSATRSLTLTIAAPPSLTFSSLPAAQAGVSYSQQLTVTGGTAPFTWAVSSGSLPPGITLDPSTGLLAGTPTTAGSYPFTVEVTDAFGQTASRAATLSVAAGPLVIAKTASAPSAAQGETVTYTVTTTNTAASPFTGVTFTDALGGVLDDATYNADVSASSGAAAFTGSAVTWTGDLAVGATATVTYSVTVANPGTGDQVLSSSVTSPTVGTICPAGGTDPRCASRVTVSILTLTASSDVSTTIPTGVIRRTFTAVNNGQTPYSGRLFAIGLTDEQDDATYLGDGQATSGQLTADAHNLYWTGNLAPGASVTITASVQVRNPDTGNRMVRTTISSTAQGSNCPPGGTDPACTTTVTVLIPALTITKTANTGGVTPGGTVTYTIQVANTGQAPYTGATVSDSLAALLDHASYNGDATATTGSVTYAAQTLTWTGDLAVGASATITFSITTLSSTTGDGALVNTATSSALGANCPPGGTDPACTAAVQILVPRLTIAKSASAATSTPGGVTTYTVTVTNAGQVPYPAASFTDPLAGVLDDAVYNNDVTATTGTASYAAPVLSWTGALAASASATIVYSVTTDSPAAGDGLLTNTITSPSEGSNCPAGGTDTRCTVTVPIAQLIISSAFDQPTATPGSVIRATTTVTNTGQVPYTGITISSDGTDIGDDVISNGDQTANFGTLSVSAAGGVWSGDIPVGATLVVTATMTIRDPDPGNRVLSGSSTTDAPGSNCPPGGTDPRCSLYATVVVPGLTVGTTANASTALPGGTVAYTTTVTNSGQTPYTGVTVTAGLSGLLDDAVYNADAVASAGTVSLAGSALTWTGDLAVGATATITFSATIRDPDPGDKTVLVTTTSTAAGSSCPQVTTPGCLSGVVVLTPALTIHQTADAATALPGQTVTWTITVANTGQSSYPAATISESLAGILDDAGYNGDAVASTGSVSYTAPTLAWTGALAPGATATITFTTTVGNPAPGDQALTGTVVSTSAGANCPAGGTDPSCTTTVPITAPALLTLTTRTDVPSAPAGDTVTYTITVANGGATPYTGAALTDDLSEVLDQSTYNGDVTASAGTVGITGSTLSWNGNVPASGLVTITFSVTVGTFSDGTLTDQLESGSSGSNCAAGSADPRCTSTVTVSRLAINVTTVSSAVPGQRIAFTATFTNTGATPYSDITVTLASAGIRDDATPTGDQTASSGTLVTIPGQALVWRGPIAVGATVTITASSVINNPDLGDRIVQGAFVTSAPGSNCPPGGTDPACGGAVQVLIPGLTMTTAANTTSAEPGQVVGYTTTITNSGQTPYAGAVVTADLTGALDDAIFNGDAVASAGTPTFAGQTLTWTGDLAVGAVVTVTYSLTVRDPDPGDKVLVTMLASTETGSSCPPNSANAGCLGSVAVLTPALTVTSSVSAATVLPGETVTFTIAISNAGQVPYTGATVTDALADVLDDAAYNGDAAATAGTVDVTGSTLTWTGDLNPDASATVTFSVTVRAQGAGGGDGVLTSTAASAAAGNNCPAGSGDARCSATARISELTIATAIDRTSAGPGDVIHSTITITNTGQVPYPGATVSFGNDDTDNFLTYNGDAAATVGTLTFGPGGVQLTWNGDLAPGQTATITLSVTVNPITQGGVVTNFVESTTPGSTCTAGGTDPACSATLTLLVPQLTIQKTPSTTATLPGGTVTWTITIANTGQTPYTAATLADDLTGLSPDADYNGDATATAGTLTYTEPLLTWTGDLAVGASVTITYSATVHQQILGPHALITTVSSTELGSTCPPDSGNNPSPCRTIVLILIPQLTITKTASTGGTTVAGSPILYTVTVANAGQTPYTGASFTDDLSGVLDDAAYNNDAAATTGTVSYTSPHLTWTGDLAVGASATVTYSVTTALPANGDHTATNVVSSATAGADCLAGGTDTACTATTAILVPALTITKVADRSSAVVGSTIGYTITATNTGEAPYPAASISDDLTGLAGNATWNNDATATTGAVSFTAPVLTWTGSLAVGASVTITYSVTVDPTATPGAALANQAASAAPGSTCTGSGSGPACTATTTIEAQTLSLTDLPTSFTLSGVPNQTVTADHAVTMTVITNSADGYTVSVQGTAPALAGTLPGNDDTIPLDMLSVRATGGGAFQPLSHTTAVLVHSQDVPSAAGGDAISNDYSVDIPFVASDTYSTTLDYIAATQ